MRQRKPFFWYNKERVPILAAASIRRQVSPARLQYHLPTLFLMELEEWVKGNAVGRVKLSMSTKHPDNGSSAMIATYHALFERIEDGVLFKMIWNRVDTLQEPLDSD